MKRIGPQVIVSKKFAGLRLVTLVVSAFLSIVAVGGDVFAQEASTGSSSGATAADAAQDRELIRQLVKRVEELEAQVRELKSVQARSPAAVNEHQAPESTPARNGSASAPLWSSEQHDHDHDDGHTTKDGLPIGLPSLNIRGFTDLSFRASDLKGETNSFVLGQFDLFITSRLTDKLSMLSEVVIENGQDNRFAIDIERLLLQYSPRDYFNLSIGRYHTAIGYYNTAYHHGVWFETATGRPFIFNFEDQGGILPIHNVGLSANGRIPSGSLRLGYIAEVGNGRRSLQPTDEPVQNVVDQDNGKAVNLGLITRPDWLPGLQAGISVYRDRLQREGGPKVYQTITAVHVVYQNPKFEFLNEVILVRDAPKGMTAFNTPAFYSQISKQFGAIRPYFRYDYLNAAYSDPVIGSMGRREGPVIGVRYDVSEFAAFKAEYQRIERRHRNTENAMTLQVAFTF